jgi:hypothetical protein
MISDRPAAAAHAETWASRRACSWRRPGSRPGLSRTRTLACSEAKDARLDAGAQLPGRVQQRLVDQQLVGADPGRLSRTGRPGQAVQVPLQAGPMVHGQEQQHPVLRPPAAWTAGRGQRGAGHRAVRHGGSLSAGIHHLLRTAGSPLRREAHGDPASGFRLEASTVGTVMLFSAFRRLLDSALRHGAPPGEPTSHVRVIYGQLWPFSHGRDEGGRASRALRTRPPALGHARTARSPAGHADREVRRASEKGGW